MQKQSENPISEDRLNFLVGTLLECQDSSHTESQYVYFYDEGERALVIPKKASEAAALRLIKKALIEIGQDIGVVEVRRDIKKALNL